MNAPRVLFVVYECNPEWSSVPGFAFHLYDALRQHANVTLVTHGRNRQAIERVADTRQIIFVEESRAAATYYRGVARIARRGRVRWNLLSLLTYPIYAEFDARVSQRLHHAVAHGSYDMVHAFTPVPPRYPYTISQACKQTPFFLGPVNGGLNYPAAFQDIARAEADRVNRLRGLARWLPGYTSTYARADKILCGSNYVMHDLQTKLRFQPDKFAYICDNGVPQAAFNVPRRAPAERIRLLFVGRLVLLKGVDILLSAVQQLEQHHPGRFQLTIVGDGEERAALEQLVHTLGIIEQVKFVGWINQRELGNFFADADIFCFPSIREFGGAVVLEAMAAGLPCLVAAYGGPAEYVTPQAGFTLSINSREQLITEMVQRIEQLANDAGLRAQMSTAATARAREFTWDCKAAQLIELYQEQIAKYKVDTDKHGLKK